MNFRIQIPLSNWSGLETQSCWEDLGDLPVKLVSSFSGDQRLKYILVRIKLQLTLVLANLRGPSNLVRYNEEFGKSELFKNGFKNDNYTIFDSTACFNDQIKSLQEELKPIKKFFNCCLLFLHFLSFIVY